MTDERDERRLKDIERQRETGGTVYHGDGTSSQVGSDYGPGHGRATGSDGREYREDFAGNMRRDVGSEPIPVPQFRGPSYPTGGGGSFEWNLPGRLEFKLGLIGGGVFLIGQLWRVFDGWLASHAVLFLGSVAAVSWFVLRRVYGHFRWIWFGVVGLYFAVRLWGLVEGTPNQTPASGHSAPAVSAGSGR